MKPKSSGDFAVNMARVTSEVVVEANMGGGKRVKSS